MNTYKITFRNHDFHKVDADDILRTGDGFFTCAVLDGEEIYAVATDMIFSIERVATRSSCNCQ